MKYKKYFSLFVFLALLLLSAGTATAALDNAEAYYAFDTGSGTTAIDSSVNANDGTINGSSWTSTANAKLGNSALSFDGTNDYVDISSFTFDTSQSFTINAWVNLDSSISGTNTIMSFKGGSSFQDVFLTYGRVSNKFSYVFVKPSTATQIDSTTNPSLSTWYMVTAVYDQPTNTMTLYVNANNEGTDNPSGTDWTTNNNLIGDRASVEFFNGIIDEPSFYSRSLSSTEVSDLYNSGTGFNPYPVTPTSNNFEVTATDQYTTNSLTNFTAEINGTNYSTTNGTITTDILDNSTSLYNITISTQETSYSYNDKWNNVSFIYDGDNSTQATASSSTAVTTAFYGDLSGTTVEWNVVNDNLVTTPGLSQCDLSDFRTRISINKAGGLFSGNTKYGCYNGTDYVDWGGSAFEQAINESIVTSDGVVQKISNEQTYFPRTYNNFNVSSNLQAELHQAEITFFAHNKVSGLEVTDFTATAPNAQSNTDTNPRLNVTIGELTYNFSKSGYYVSQTLKTLFPLEKGTSNFSVYDHKLNVTVNVGSGSASEDNFTIDLTSLNYTYSETLSTTDGWVLFNLTDGTYNITLNDSIHELQTETITLNSTVNFTNYEFQARTARTFDIEFFNETNNELLNNSNITVEFISDSNAFNTSTTNGTILVDLLTPDEYQIKYSIVGSEVIRNYFVTLSEQSYEELDLYLIDEDISAYYVANVVDASSNACQQNTVSLLRYYVDVNQYKVVEMSQSNSQGQAVFRVKPNNVDYKFFFSGSCGEFTSAPTRLIDSSNSYTITGGQELLESLYAISGASTSLTYVNATETFAYSWTSDSNIITQGCLTVQKRKDGARTTVGTQCASGNTGTASITINDTNETTYFASGKLFTNTEFSDSITNNLEISFLTGFFDNANYAPFAALIIFVAVVLAMGVSASGLVIGSVAALIGLSFFSFIQISTATIFGFITIGVAILYLARGRGA